MARCTENKHTEEVLDFSCTQCITKNKRKRAKTFCETCNTFFCYNCLSFHDEMFKNHIQLGPEEFTRKADLRLPTERCGRHRNELAQMYCRDHDVVVCNTCVSMQHRSCTGVVFIPNEVQNLMGSDTLATFRMELNTSLETLRNDEQSAEVSLKTLSDKRYNLLQSIENHGQMLKAVIDGMVKKSKKEIQEKYHAIKDEFQKEMRKTQACKQVLEGCIQQFDIAEKESNDSQMFVSMKKCQAKLTVTNKHHSAFKTWEETIQLKYISNEEIENSLKKFTSLGSVIDQHTQPSLYTVKAQETVQLCQEGTKCNITDSCQLPHGAFLLTDWTHKKIVHLDSSCSRITDQCLVPGSPYAVCLTGDNEVAVSLQPQQNIQFVSLGAEMALTRSVKLQHTCRGLAFSQGELFVSDMSSHVYVYDTTGTPLRTLGNSAPGQGSQLRGTDHIAISLNGQRVYVATRKGGLMCMDRNGKQLFKYSGAFLKSAHGVCTDDRGSVFVCGYDSHNVVQLTEDGHILGILLQQFNEEPDSVCFDSRNKRLLVTKDFDSSVSVYELE